MTSFNLQKLMQQACVIEIRESQLVLEQQKDRYGVCIIPKKQDQAAQAIISKLGRTITEIAGSKRGTLRYTFSPPLSEEEYDALNT